MKIKKTAEGNPFFALRVPADVLRAFQAAAKKQGKEPTALVRAFMVRTGGKS
jgi:hypothetical protein